MKPSNYGILSTLPRFWFGITAIVFVLANLSPAAAASPEETSNSLGMKLVAIRAGEFMMGATEDVVKHQREQANKKLQEALKKAGDDAQQQEDAKKRFAEEITGADSISPHHVIITKPFLLGKFKVTQKEYSTVMGVNPSFFQANGKFRDKVEGLDTSHFPIERVSWEDAAEFCRQLSAMPEEASAGRTYRLPTEAEWEYACRAGTTTTYYWGDKPGPDGPKYEWSRDDNEGLPHPVGAKLANPWGLFDMCGSGCELCADWYDAKYYQASPERDPPGPADGELRVFRGNYRYLNVASARSYTRRSGAPSLAQNALGLRVACDIKPVPKKSAEPANLPEAGKKAEAQLKGKGLVSQSGYFVLPGETDFVRYTSTLERLRINCFHAQKEADEAKRQLSLARAAQVGAVKSRMQASRVAGYSITWRDHWNAQRIHNLANDAVLLAQLNKEDIEAWNKEVQEDFKSALDLYGGQLKKLKAMYQKLQTDYSLLTDDQTVAKALAAMNTGGKVSYRLGLG